MPIYVYRCNVCGLALEKHNPVAFRRDRAPYCHGAMHIEITPSFVNPDITPYQAMAGDRAGQYITSRREHREFLKRNRFVEVGNEPIRPVKNNFAPKRGEIAAELKKVIPDVLGRRNH